MRRIKITVSKEYNVIIGKDILCTLGADITKTADGLIINGKPVFDGGDTESFGDHRIAMAAAIPAAD